MRMRNIELGKALNTWYSAYLEEKRQRYVLNGALNRMIKRSLSMAFEKWQMEAATMKSEKALINDMMKKWLKRALLPAWFKWREQYAELKEQSRLIGGALNRLRSRLISMAYNRWREIYEEMMREKALLRQAVGRMRRRELAKAFGKWRLQAEVDKRIAALEAAWATNAGVLEAIILSRLMRRVIKRMWKRFSAVGDRLYTSFQHKFLSVGVNGLPKTKKPGFFGLGRLKCATCDLIYDPLINGAPGEPFESLPDTCAIDMIDYYHVWKVCHLNHSLTHGNARDVALVK